MSQFFKPYEGTRPFFFVSYAHRQSDAVVSTIRILHEKGYRLWYDEGIPAGTDWPANIAHHMQSCERVVFFLSARAMESPNCYSEMRTAARLKKPVLVVRLEQVPIEERWQELLEGKQEIPLLDTPEERVEAIVKSGFLPRRFHSSWWEKIPWRAFSLAASMLLFAGAAGSLGLLATGRWNPIPIPDVVTVAPEPTAVPTPAPVVDIGGAERFFAIGFPDTQQERGIRKALNIPSEEVYRWQLAEITEQYYCGNLVMNSTDGVAFGEDGSCTVNGARVITGQVSDLSLLEYQVSLEKLALICQPLGDISALSGHLLLRELSLAGSSVSDLSRLDELPSLESIHLEHTEVNDLTPLEALPNLKIVTVSREMLPLQWSNNANFAVILVREGN